jgi:osmotically-inducible protein OsmY
LRQAVYDRLFGYAPLRLDLALDSRTAGQHIGVYPRLGEMHLRGGVRTRAAHEGASNVAKAVPSATQIVNELRIDLDANEMPMRSSAGWVTNCEDMVPGGR